MTWDGSLADTGWVNVGASGAPAFQNGWSNFGAGYVVARYRRKDGLTHVQYAVTGGTLGQAVFVLPAGFCPGYYLVLTGASATTPARVDVPMDGRVIVAGASNTIVAGVLVFPAEA